MRRICKQSRNIRGFSLVEVLLVVGIIVILAGAVALGVNDVLNPAKKAQSSVAADKITQSKLIHSSESKLRGYGF
ncbi:MAG: type II secretion system protein [Ruminococcaceae bacterium]|nr:type II secretion system protein [Oscillospiraceae bacterium]